MRTLSFLFPADLLPGGSCLIGGAFGFCSCLRFRKGNLILVFFIGGGSCSISPSLYYL